MYFVYRLLLTLGFLILIPRFIFDAFRHGKYVAGFNERLGKLTPLEKTSGPIVWLHCVSVGESQAARPLVSEIRKRFPNHTIVVSTTTLTGQRLAREIFKADVAKVFYFPFDWSWTVRRALNAVSPDVVLIMETEIWPGFFKECESRRIPIAIVNGRLSASSFRRYLWIKGFVRRVLRGLSLAVMQTEKDAERMCALGMDPAKIVVSGNMKFDAGTIAPSSSLADEFRARFQLTESAPLIIAASTHEPEESLILKAFRQTRKICSTKPRLLLAPRHPERFDEVASLLDKTELSWTRRSSVPAEADRNCDVILLDTIGELSAVYALGQVVFVGGSIAASGGHNILEPAGVGSAIITGPHTHNFEAITRFFVKNNAIIQLSLGNSEESIQSLVKSFTELLSNDRRRGDLQRKAKKLLEQNVGATERTIKYLLPLLASEGSEGARSRVTDHLA